VRGHIRKRGKGYAIAIYLGKDGQGRRRYHWATRPTRQAAEDYLIAALPEAQAGRTLTETRLSVAEYLNQWLEGGRTNWAPKTAYGHKIRIARLTAILGSIPLRRLTSGQLVEYYQRRAADGLAENTIAADHMTMHAALGDAVRRGLLIRNVAKGFRAPHFKPRQMTVWDTELIQLFLAAARRHSRHWMIYELELFTGLRQGELLALRWSDVDWIEGTLHITRTVAYSRETKQAIFGIPKTRSGRRAVPLGAHVLADLQTWKTSTAGTHQGLLFPRRKDGGPQRAEVIQHDFHKTIAAAKLPQIRFHDLRHCHATQLLTMGVPVKVVQERLGHSRASVTLDVYAHVLPTIQREAARALEQRLLGRQKRARRAPNRPPKAAQ